MLMAKSGQANPHDLHVPSTINYYLGRKGNLQVQEEENIDVVLATKSLMLKSIFNKRTEKVRSMEKNLLVGVPMTPYL